MRSPSLITLSPYNSLSHRSGIRVGERWVAFATKHVIEVVKSTFHISAVLVVVLLIRYPIIGQIHPTTVKLRYSLQQARRPVFSTLISRETFLPVYTHVTDLPKWGYKQFSFRPTHLLGSSDFPICIVT